MLGKEQVSGVRVRNVKTGEKRVLETDGVFLYVGLVPNTQLFEGQLELDEQRYIVTDKRQWTNVPGVFADDDVSPPLSAGRHRCRGGGSRSDGGRAISRRKRAQMRAQGAYQ